MRAPLKLWYMLSHSVKLWQSAKLCDDKSYKVLMNQLPAHTLQCQQGIIVKKRIPSHYLLLFGSGSFLANFHSHFGAHTLALSALLFPTKSR